MEAISSLVKVSLPNYLRSLPLPNSIGGIFQLSGGDFIAITPFVVTVSLIGFALVRLVVPAKQKPIVNRIIKKDNPKVVNLVQIEDLDKEKISYCRCWKSEKFPICDGSHNKHNEETGDNVGPLVIKCPAKAK